MLNKKSGIYKITNLINNKCYIGSGISIKSRFYQHRTSLNKNKHFNKHFQNAWNFHGEENFKFEILEYCKRENLLLQEEFWIKYYDSNNPEKGYNKRIDCKTNLGNKATLETRLKQSLSHLGHKRSKETQQKISKKQYKKFVR